MNEVWKPVSVNNAYEISNKGRVRSLPGRFKKSKQPVEIKGWISFHGYRKIELCNSGKRTVVSLHQLIARAFIPNPDNKPEVNHIDGNKLNNDILNLEWVTRAENAKHAGKTGLMRPLHGVRNHFAKLTEDQVLLIRQSPLPTASLSSMYNVSRSTVNRIRNGYNWKKLIGVRETVASVGEPVNN